MTVDRWCVRCGAVIQEGRPICEACRQAEEQKKIEQMAEALKEREKKIEKMEDMARKLFNRCAAVWSGGGVALSDDGALCAFCGMRRECDEMRSVRGKGRLGWNG